MSWEWRGQAFEWDGTLAGLIEPKQDEDILRTSIKMILFTRQGERVMLRDFGTTLHEKVFEPNDLLLRNEIVDEIRRAIRKWDDRVGIESLNVVQQEHVFTVQIVFYNMKDPLRTTKTFAVTLGELGVTT